MMRPKVTWHWGLSYKTSLQWQQTERISVQANNVASSFSILLCEHLPTITLGKRGGHVHIQRSDTTVEQINRGGLATWHGPGQLAFYPIVPLNQHKIGIRQYICLLEGVVIQVLNSFGVNAHRGPSPGLWIKERKIASIGIEVRDGVTNHGIAINVHPDLSRFTDIIPCGDASIQFTSVRCESNQDVSILELGQRCILKFTEAYSQALH